MDTDSALDFGGFQDCLLARQQTPCDDKLSECEALVDRRDAATEMTGRG